MRISLRQAVLVIVWLFTAARAGADVLVRWDQNDVPSRDNLGVAALLVPAGNATAVHNAVAQGFNVYIEVEASALPGFTAPSERLAGVVVRGQASAEQLAALRGRLTRSGGRVRATEQKGTWPHIRSNVVTTRDGVLQVAGRTAQPWLEHNVAVMRMAHRNESEPRPLLSYRWEPRTSSEAEHGPALEDYLVAIAEAGSFGGDLVLPLHEQVQKALLLGKPAARRWWGEIRRYIEFYSWNSPERYRRIANIGIVTADPMRSFEEAKLLARHNLPFEVIAPDRLEPATLAAMRLLIVPQPSPSPQLGVLAEFARKGGTLVIAAASDATYPWRAAAPLKKTDDRATYQFGEGRVVEVLKRIADPNMFALEVRDVLGRERRVIDIWNGITVLAAPYAEGDGKSVLVTVVNYAHDAESVQLRIPGTYSVVEYESPEEEPALLPYTHRNGYTEFVLPALRVGGRVFLSRQAGLD